MIKPVNNKLLVEEVIVEKIGSIFLPTDNSNTNTNSKVIAMSNDCHLKDLKVGDVVLHAKFGGEKVEDEGKKYKLIDSVIVQAIVYADEKEEE